MKKYIKEIHPKYNEDKTIFIIIPCAGLGRRMKSYGSKSLLEIDGKSIIKRQLDSISSNIKNYEIALITGFDSERLMDHTPDHLIKIENEKYYETNVARSINIGLRASKNHEHVLIIYGDIVFSKTTLNHLDFSKSFILISNNMLENEVGCNINKKGILEFMMFDLPNKWGQILYLTGKELELFKKICCNRTNDRKFGFEIINEVISKGGKFNCITHDEINIIDIDNSKDILLAKEVIK